MTTTAPPATFSPDTENGLLVTADQLLGDAHDRDAAWRLTEASEQLEDAKVAKNEAVARLDEIALIFPTSTGADRKKLNDERLQLAGELAFAAADISALAETFVSALIPYATQVHAVARSYVARLNKPLLAAEGKAIKAREDREQIRGVDRGQAIAMNDAGLSPDPSQIGDGEDRRAQLSQTLDALGTDIQKQREKRDEYQRLASAAEKALTKRFGEGSYESLFLTSGIEQYLTALRHRTAAQVSRFVGAGTQSLNKPPSR